jgi:hypothetical protein
MTEAATASLPPPGLDGELVIAPRFTGRSYIAVLRVLVAGESALDGGLGQDEAEDVAWTQMECCLSRL